MLTEKQQEKSFANYMGSNSQYITLGENVESEKSQAKACSGNIFFVEIAKQGNGDQFDERESEDEH